MPLNLERSLKMGEEIGGHLVSGHVHCMGKVKEFKKGKEKIAKINKLKIPLILNSSKTICEIEEIRNELNLFYPAI